MGNTGNPHRSYLYRFISATHETCTGFATRSDMHLNASIFFYCGESSHVYNDRLLLGMASWATILARFLLWLRFGSDIFLGVQPHFRRESHPDILFRFSDARAFPLDLSRVHSELTTSLIEPGMAHWI